MIPILRVSNADGGLNSRRLDVTAPPRPWVVPSAPRPSPRAHAGSARVPIGVHVPGMVRVLVGVRAVPLGRGLPAPGLERRVRLSGLDHSLAPTASTAPRFRPCFPRASPLFRPIPLRPKKLVLHAVSLDDHPVLPGFNYLPRAAAPGNRVALRL